MKITKKELEDQLGYKIQDFSIDPIYDADNDLIVYSVRVHPVQSVKEINITGIIKDERGEEDMWKDGIDDGIFTHFGGRDDDN